MSLEKPANDILLKGEAWQILVDAQGVIIPFNAGKRALRTPLSLQKAIREYLLLLCGDDYNGRIIVDVGVPAVRNNTRGLVIHTISNSIGSSDLHVQVSTVVPENMNNTQFMLSI